MTDTRLLASYLRRNFGLEGVCAAGIAPLTEVEEKEIEHYAAWLDSGKAAGMGYLANHESLRRDPAMLLEGAKSIMSLSFPYPAGEERLRSLPAIASYAMGMDYHDVLRNRLTGFTERLKAAIGGEYRICIDSAPIFERYWAEKCGVGKRADNGLIAVAGFGTRVFLAEILCTLPTGDLLPILHPAEDSEESEEDDIREDRPLAYCSHCGACRRVCPAGALLPDSTVDARRCLSYLTIEHRGDWDAEGKKAMSTPAGRHTLYGCDLCQRVCPLNHSQGAASPLPEFMPRPELLTLDAEDVIGMSQADFSRIFKGSPMKRAKLAGLQRNALNCQSMTLRTKS